MLTLMVPGHSRKVRCLCGHPLPTYWLRGSVAVQLRCPYCGSMFVARMGKGKAGDPDTGETRARG